MCLCYTLEVWLGTILNTRNVAPSLEWSNMFTGYGTIHNDDEDLILKEENLEIYAHLENVLVHMIDTQDVAIFKSQKRLCEK